ncbi:MAG: helix-turn-helix transcriptional regulator, partial [Escherichia coli]|nr:helix-turn-helix transcriptional regulator [Escherichia coli]
IRCVCGKKIGPDPRNFNQRVSLGRNDLLIRTFLADMAATIPCSEAWLRRLFLRYTGKTPKEYYLDARLDLALSLLKQQGNSVGEVADTLNFFDSFHFSKAFKHKFGYAPSAVLKNTDQHPTDASPHN